MKKGEKIVDQINQLRLFVLFETVRKTLSDVEKWRNKLEEAGKYPTKIQSLVIKELSLLNSSLEQFNSFLECPFSSHNFASHCYLRLTDCRSRYLEILYCFVVRQGRIPPLTKICVDSLYKTFAKQSVRELRKTFLSKEKFEKELVGELKSWKRKINLKWKQERCIFSFNSKVDELEENFESLVVFNKSSREQFNVVYQIDDSEQAKKSLILSYLDSPNNKELKRFKDFCFSPTLYKEVNEISFFPSYPFLDSVSWSFGRRRTFQELEDNNSKSAISSIKLFKQYLIVESEESVVEREKREVVYQQNIEKIYFDELEISELDLISADSFNISEISLVSNGVIEYDEVGQSLPKILIFSSALLRKRMVENINVYLPECNSCIKEIRFEPPYHNFKKFNCFSEEPFNDYGNLTFSPFRNTHLLFQSIVSEMYEVVQSIGFWRKLEWSETPENPGAFVYEDPIINFPLHYAFYLSKKGSLDMGFSNLDEIAQVINC